MSLPYLFSIFRLIYVWMQLAMAEGSYGSNNLMGAVSDTVASTMMLIMIVLTLLAYAAYLVITRGMGKEGNLKLLGLSVILVLMILMVVNKVFSSQYVMWIIVPMAFIIVSERSTFNR